MEKCLGYELQTQVSIQIELDSDYGKLVNIVEQVFYSTKDPLNKHNLTDNLSGAHISKQISTISTFKTLTKPFQT